MSETTPSSNTDELLDLIRKDEGIISTHTASDLEASAESVEEKYRTYAETHISLGDTSGFEQKVYDSLTENEKPTKGYLYGPFGYGKTSTSVSVWHKLNQNEIIAVPPFTVSSFSAIMRATYGWMHYKLRTEAPPYVDELENIRESYLEKEIRSYAEEKKDTHDFGVDKLVTMFEEMERTGELDLSINADTLIDFFDECTKLAADAGFEGLVVLGDELQQYFKSADNRQDAEANFRDLIWDIHSGAQINSEFGFFVSMPAQTKSSLDTRAGDVLNRLESDNLMLNLENVYGQNFPAELWNEYSSRFGFEDQQHDVITAHTLNAIGQICSRPELSNGPRTVIDIFRIALLNYQTSRDPFTALDLAEAFYNGEVRFQGSSTIIQSAIGDALDHSSVATEEQRTFIMLCGIFPEQGIPEAAVEEYGLLDARRHLSKKLHGEVIKVIDEGYTLIDVTRSDGPQDVVRELIRDFWSEYDTDHPNAEYAHNALANRLVGGEIFEPQRGKLEGWGVGDGLDKEAPQVYRRHGMIGTFDPNYPKRSATISVTDPAHEEGVVSSANLGPAEADNDIAFNFVLGWEKADETVDPHIRRDSSREYTFMLNGRKTFEELPNGIEFLRDAMDPKAVNPFLMLALVDYLDTTNKELDPQQKQRIDSFQNSLLKQAIQTLFGEELIENAPFEIRRAGKMAVSTVFSKAIKDLYPDYSTLITSTQYESVMGDYLDFLDSLQTVSLCRGIETLKEPKDEVAGRFGLKNTSPFDGRIKKHYSDILTVENSDKDKYEVRATLHPFEQFIIDELESGDREEFPLEEITQIGYNKGYKTAELDLIFEFLSRRRIVGLNDDDSLVLLETDYSIAQVEEILSTGRDLLTKIEKLDQDGVPDGVETAFSEVEETLEETNPEDGERLETLYYHTKEQVEKLEQQGEILYTRHHQACQDLKDRIERKSRQVVPNYLDNTIEGGVQFVGGVNDARASIRGEYTDINNKLTAVASELENTLGTQAGKGIDGAVELSEKQKEAKLELDSVEKEVEELEEDAAKLKDWKAFTAQVAGVKEEITDYARTFDEDSVDEEDEINRFISQISERFAEDPVGALDNLEGFKENLNRIESQYKSKRKEHQKVFDEKRELLKEILQEATDGKARGLRSANFSIRNPEESRRNLLEEFKDTYRKSVIERAEENIEDARREIEYGRVVGIEETVDANPNDVEEEILTAESTLQSLRSELDQFSFTDIGNETNLGNGGRDLLDTTDDINEDAKEFRYEQEPDREAVEETLDRIMDHRRVDFKDLLMEYHDDGDTVDPEELLDRIQRLFVLNQIDIEISQRRGR